MWSRLGKRRYLIRRKRALLDSIDTSTHAGLRDRALIGLMVYSFARIGAALGMTVEDVFTQNRESGLKAELAAEFGGSLFIARCFLFNVTGRCGTSLLFRPLDLHLGRHTSMVRRP
jgi:hypothetical protein